MQRHKINKILLIPAMTLIMICFPFIPNVLSQPNWYWQNPLPSGDNLYRIKFIDDNTGYATGTNFAIIKTTNAGQTWLMVNQNIDSLPPGVFAEGYLPALFFINSETGFVGGNNLFKTTDGGNRWTYLSSPISPMIALTFVNSETGFLTGSKIAKTTNQGATWFLLNTGISLDGLYENISFLSPEIGFSNFNSTTSNIIKTTNSGNNWHSIYSVNQHESFASLFFTEADVGYAVSGYLKRTTNGGLNWVNILQPYLGNSVYFSSLSTGILSTNQGNIYRTTNSGINWNLYRTFDVNFMSFKNDTTGYFVGKLGKILKSTNSGINWFSPSNNFYDNVSSIDFISDDTGYAAGIRLFKTSNAGESWVQQNLNYKYSFTNINFFDRDHAYLSCENISGEPNIIIKTNDGGMNWDSVASFESINKTQFLDMDTGFIMSYGTLYRTVNGGETWTGHGLPTSNVYRSFHFFNAEEGIIMLNINNLPINLLTRVYKTTNAGDDWELLTQIATGTPDGRYMLGMHFFDRMNGYMYGFAGFFKTWDGGFHWEKTFNEFIGEKPYFYNLNVGYCPALYDKLYKTINGGINWTLILNLGEGKLNTAFFTSANTGYLVGNDGIIMKTTNGGSNLVGASNIILHNPDKFILEQNYPNPFNPVTLLKFVIPISGFVSLKVYDVLGKEIKTLVNENRPSGNYKIEFDGSNLSSGVYFYRLEVSKPSPPGQSDFVQTKRMVMIK